MKGFQGPSAPAKAQPAFEAYEFDLINLSRQSFNQGELKGGRNWNYHWKVSSIQGPSAPAKAQPAFEAYTLISLVYLDRVLVKENYKERETETITERISGPIITC